MVLTTVPIVILLSGTVFLGWYVSRHLRQGSCNALNAALPQPSTVIGLPRRECDPAEGLDNPDLGRPAPEVWAVSPHFSSRIWAIQ